MTVPGLYDASEQSVGPAGSYLTPSHGHTDIGFLFYGTWCTKLKVARTTACEVVLSDCLLVCFRGWVGGWVRGGGGDV